MIPFSAALLDAQQPYFPPKSFDSFLSAYFSNALTALNEPSLFQESKESQAESYRFVWLRTFHHAVAVQLDVRGDGTGEITAHIGAGVAGFPHTWKGPPTSESRPLGKEQVTKFLELVDHLNFWSVPTEDDRDQTGMDGAFWVIEAVKAGQYHVIARWSPSDPPEPSKRVVRELGLMLAFELAGLHIPNGEIY